MVDNKKNLIITSILILTLILSLLTACGSNTNSGTKDNTDTNKQTSEVPKDELNDKVLNIGITQIVEHAALDSAREGFIKALEDNGYKDGENIKLDYQNAQDDMPTAQTIAKNFASQKKDLIFAIATPTAQAAYNATKDIPILITAVTDPVVAGLVKDWEKSGTNVTGTSDMTPIDKQFELLKQLLPEAKTVGIIYNTSESNSDVQVKKAKEIAPDLGLEIKTQGITNVNEIPQALDSILGDIDVLYVPTDNKVASSMPLLKSKTQAQKIPIIGSEKAHVENGAIATEGIDYFKLGYQTGEMAIEIMKDNKKPEDMPVSTLENTELVLNMDAINELGINVPDEIKNKAVIIKEGE